MTSPTPLQGRLLVLTGAVLWSLNGALTKLLTRPDVSPLGEPPVSPLLIAFYRTLFAGLIVASLVRRKDIAFRPLMLVMMLCFATMNAMFISASALGTAANAILLQYTAPIWLFLVSVCFLKEPARRRDIVTLIIAMTGVLVIVGGSWGNDESLPVVLIALGSGVTFAGVILCLRLLRASSSPWLTLLNQSAASLLLLPVLFYLPSPTMAQFGVLVFFGVVQLGLPYVLVSRGLKSISPQEAGSITLLEPLLNPLWTYWVAGEVPANATFIGGALILAALAWRYFPTRLTKV